jgi:nucleotide-binding universal stress UspA family protein
MTARRPHAEPAGQAPGHYRPSLGHDIAVDAVPMLKLLVPINAREDSRWALRYAAQRRRAGAHVDVVLLNVGEPITQWEVLRFRTQPEITQFQSERAQAFIDEASTTLHELGIPVRGVFRQGGIVFSILDVAEELACDEIVMPREAGALAAFFGGDIVAEVRRRQRGVPLVTVDADGRPV